tara:strand:+ start:709 stop:990 length:282 start_codon:yes stop_codon:yes gene_type:complete
MGTTAANKNRAIRQEALREQLSSQGHVQHVVEMLNEIQDLQRDLDANDLARYKVAIDTKLKLIGKYLPDLKSVEHTGDEDAPIAIAAYEINWE